MIKRIVIFLATIVLLFLIGYFSHQYYLERTEEITKLTPFSMYGFQAIATIIIYIAIEGVFKIMPNELGYLYLASATIKIGVFILIFQNEIFSDTPLTGSEKTLLVIPFFIFLFAEVTAVGLLLNKASFDNKVS